LYRFVAELPSASFVPLDDVFDVWASTSGWAIQDPGMFCWQVLSQLSDQHDPVSAWDRLWLWQPWQPTNLPSHLQRPARWEKPEWYHSSDGAMMGLILLWI
jgi:hypothetical protein